MPTEQEKLQALVATREHIEVVRNLLNLAVAELLRRGEQHDQSKLVEPELSTFAEYTPKLAQVTYGSPEYKQQLVAMGPVLQHHYAHNRHHPEHHREGIDGMTLFDLLEMLLDWYASTKRHADGDIYDSLVKNKERFGLSKQLYNVLCNTAQAIEDLQPHGSLLEEVLGPLDDDGDTEPHNVAPEGVQAMLASEDD